MLDYKLSAQNACPAFLQFVADLKKGDVSSQFIRELDGCDLANSEAIADALAPAVTSFLDTVAYPFLRALLRFLKVSFEESDNIKRLIAVERVVFPSGLTDLPRRFTQGNMNQGRSLVRLPLETPAEHTLFVSTLDFPTP